MAIEFQEIRLTTPHLELAGLRWGDPDGIPVLALHGWLDNANSFAPLAPLLQGVDLVALDWPGHGQSQHRHPSAHYQFSEYLLDIDAALNALGWGSCHLIGHSMGGGVGTLFACAAPERVRSLVLLDVIGPMSGTLEDTADRLRRSLADSRKPARRRKRYESTEQMVQARMANSDIQQDAARLITERSAVAVDDGFEWRNDPALYWTSPFYITEEQALQCLSHIEAPVYSLIAQPFAPFIREEQFQQRKQAIRRGRHELVEGGHHFHMEQPETIAARLHCFIMEQEKIPKGELGS